MEAMPHWWARWLVVVVLGGVALRVAFALAVAPDLPVPGDAVVYREMASHLAAGDGLAAAGPDTQEITPTAEHPPLFPGLLAVLDLAGLGSIAAQRVALAVVSGGGVAIVGLAGRRVAGPLPGVLAAGMAAVHPLWLQPAGMVMSESLQLVLVPAVLLVALQVAERATARRVAALGLLVGLAALNRPESLGYLLVIVVPAVALARAATGGRWRLVVVGVVACLAVVLPWVVRNQEQLGSPVMATNAGKTLIGSNCDTTYAGPHLGGFDAHCSLGSASYLVGAVPPPDGEQWTALSLDRALGDVGLRYLREHARELPRVVAARVVRLWSLGFRDDQLEFDVSEGRHRPLQQAGQWVHLGLVPLAVVGLVLLVRRGSHTDATILAGIPVLVTAAMLVVYGGPRMRAAAEPSIALLASVTLVQVGIALRHRQWRSIPGPDAPDGSVASA